MQIKDVDYDHAIGVGGQESRDDGYMEEDHNPTMPLESDSGEEVVKTEGHVDEDRVLETQKCIGDLVEVKVEEIHLKDDSCGGIGAGAADEEEEVESILPDMGNEEASPNRNRLTVCDGYRNQGVGVAGGREEFTCAVCEQIFLDPECLRNHMPCRSRTGGSRVNVSGEFGARPMGDWDHGGYGDGFPSGHVKDESGIVPDDPLGVTSDFSGRSLGSRNVSGGYTRVARGRKRGNASNRKVLVRPRNVKGAVGAERPREGVASQLITDKTISYQCDMCRHGFSRLDKLKKHIQSHSEEGGYACPTCGKSFRTRWSLKNHRKSHQRVTQYECPICSRKFSRPQHLEAHRATHGTGTEYQCGICRKTFPQSSYLEMHLRAHDGDESTQCHICGKRFSRKNVLTVHLRVHMGIKPYECQVCNKRFSQKASLKNHAASHEGGGVGGPVPYSCDLCHKSFSEKVDLNRHFKSAHSPGGPRPCEKAQDVKGLPEDHRPPLEPDPEGPSHSGGVAVNDGVERPDGHCVTPDLSHLPVSITRVKVDPRDELGSRVKVKRSPSSHSVPDVDLGPNFSISPVVDVGTGDEAGVGHLLGSADRDEKPVLNLGLDLSTKAEDGVLPAGHSETSTKVRPYKCQICHKCFGQKDELNAHLRVHGWAKPHTCEICGKRFTEGLNLRKHMLVHVEGKPPECPFCAKAFTLRKNLKRHLELDSCLKRLDLNTSECINPGTNPGRNNPTDSGAGDPWGRVPPPTDLACGSDRKDPGSALNKTLDDIMAAAKEASVEVYLEQEGSVSRVFPCTICEKTFLRTDQLKKHLMVHGGIKPHACTMCSRRFTEKGNLSKHMKTHAYEKPYPCSFCEKAYTQKKNLERHILSHQSDDAAA